MFTPTASEADDALDRVDEIQAAMRARREAASGLDGLWLVAIAVVVAFVIAGARLHGAAQVAALVAAGGVALGCLAKSGRDRKRSTGLDVSTDRGGRSGKPALYGELLAPAAGCAVLLGHSHVPIVLRIAGAVFITWLGVDFWRARRRLRRAASAPPSLGPGLFDVDPYALDVTAALVGVDSATSVAIAEVCGLAEGTVRSTADALVGSRDVEYASAVTADPPAFSLTSVGRERFAAGLAAFDAQSTRPRGLLAALRS